MKGTHDLILICMRDFFMTYGLCLNTSFASLKHITYGHATKHFGFAVHGNIFMKFRFTCISTNIRSEERRVGKECQP